MTVGGVTSGSWVPRRFVRGMIVRGIIEGHCLFFIPLTNIPLTMSFPDVTQGERPKI
jgi:hypothetical protein